MKRAILFLFMLASVFSSAFTHEAQKQTEQLQLEPLTEKWMECENAAEEDYAGCLEQFLLEVEKARPDETVVYYFPDSTDIYERIYTPSKRLLEVVRSGKQDDVSSLRKEVFSGIRGWEIFQKNLIRFQMEQLYYSYKILISVIILAMLFVLIFLTMYLLTSKTSKENRAFARQMVLTQEAERERISNELHDTVCQDLRVLQFRLEDEESVSLCKKIASDVRNTCYALTPSDLNEGILESLISLCAIIKKDSGLNIILSIQEDVKSHPAIRHFTKEKNLNIYRIVQEIITNAVKHAEAEAISVLIRSYDDDNFRIIISDDGKGFDLKHALKKKNHFGLKNVQARASVFQGEIDFNSVESEGTQVTVTIPYLTENF